MFDFFKKKKPEQPKQPVFSVGIPKEGQAVPESLKAHSKFIKRVSCPQCGAPKSKPSTTAYVYCDFCGSLMDYDFRMANANTNAGLTNTVFSRIMMTVQMQMMQAKARGDESVTVAAVNAWIGPGGANPTQNPKHWINQCYSMYYGITVLGPGPSAQQP